MPIGEEWIDPVTDRTQYDVDRARAYINSMKGRYETLEGVKGCLNISDLNRIEGNIKYLSDILSLSLTTKEWTISEIPTSSDESRIIGNTSFLLSAISMENPPTIPDNLHSYSDFNEIEDALFTIHENIHPEPSQIRYGIRINKNDNNPYNRIEYLYDAVGFTPAYMDYANGRFEYGSWKNAFFVKSNYPVMLKTDGTEDYRLDPNDHSKRLDGTASDVSNVNYDGNAFSCFDCHIWMKFYEDENYHYIEVANYKADNDFKDYPYHRGDGSIPDKLYYPMYPGYVDSNSKLRSISGVKASSGSTSAQEVTYAENNGAIWSIETWSYHLWFHVLLMLISKNFNSQMAFGNGNTSGGSSAASFKENGLLNTSGQFFGYNTGSDSIKAFYCENVWANRWSRCLGMYDINGFYKIKMVPPYTYDETYTDYDSIASPIVPATGYLKDLSFDNSYGFVPKTVGGSGTTYVGDYFWSYNSQSNLLLVGGGCAGDTRCGSWYLDLDSPAVGSAWSYGASLYLK